MDNQTITKKEQVEISKVDLFNLLYGTDFETYEENNYSEWNKISLAEHIKNSNWLPPKEKPEIIGNVRRINNSGTIRDISFHFVSGNKRLLNITYLMSWVIDEKNPTEDKYSRSVLRVGGTGMDMIFHTVYTLGNILFRGLEEDIDRTGYMLDYTSI